MIAIIPATKGRINAKRYQVYLIFIVKIVFNQDFTDSGPCTSRVNKSPATKGPNPPGIIKKVELIERLSPKITNGDHKTQEKI